VNIGEAAGIVAGQLEADEYRYPTATRILHVNQAMAQLSREYDFAYDHEVSLFHVISGLDTAPLPDDQDVTPNSRGFIGPPASLGLPMSSLSNYPGSVQLSAALDSAYLEPAYIDAVWLDPQGANTPLVDPYTLKQLLDKYGDSAGTPEAVAIHADRLWWRPIPEDGVHAMRIIWKGVPILQTESFTPRWLVYAPYAVIYATCQIASVWLLEDERAMGFRKLVELEMDSIGIEKSMRGGMISGTLVMEEP
jgi:hypothetical protein